MPRIFYDGDVDPTALRDETIAVIGYGIQGRAQALNLRDSGARVVIGNRSDEYASQAEADGFEVVAECGDGEDAVARSNRTFSAPRCKDTSWRARR